jgi:hypothetical protein
MPRRRRTADGGNSDPTSTHGKDPERAKAIGLMAMLQASEACAKISQTGSTIWS